MIYLNPINVYLTTREISSNPKKWQGVNPMGLGDPWSDSYLKQKINEMSSMMFIYKILL